MADQPSTPDTAATGHGASAGHGFVDGIVQAAGSALHNTNFADMARQASQGILDKATGMPALFHIDADGHVVVGGGAGHHGAEADQSGAEAATDQVLIIPDDGYDYVDAELIDADAGDEEAHAAQAVAHHDDLSGQSHDHDGPTVAYDVSHDA